MSSIGGAIYKYRDFRNLTQGQVARAIGVQQELISMWESDARVPNLNQLNQLALALNVDEAVLRGEKEFTEAEDRAMLLRGTENQSVEVQQEIRQWHVFLDDWAEFLSEDLGLQLPVFLSKPPKQLLQDDLVKDARRAPKLAAQVREYYNLGTDAINIERFLDNIGILIYKAPLGDVNSRGISGAFLNHPQLGFSILVNSDMTPGRQAFTLAHEFAHALYHYSKGVIYSQKGEDLERFANAFAAHFLVLGSGLRNYVKQYQAKWSCADKGFADCKENEINAEDALVFADYFDVSYNAILVRLSQENLIKQEQKDSYKNRSAVEMAELIGLNSDRFTVQEGKPLGTKKYPASVWNLVKREIKNDTLTPSQAADLLNFDLLTINKLIAPVNEASEEQTREFEEINNIYE